MYDDENGIKIILLGETGTGKSNLINICCNLSFDPNTPSNITSSILEKTINLGKIQYNIKLWDTAGQEKFRSLNNLFIKDSKICIFVYDINNRITFEELDFWVKTVNGILGNDPILAVVANKSDLKENVTKKEGEEYAKKIGAFFYQTSAKNDKNGFTNFINILVQEFLFRNNLNGWEIIYKENERFSLGSDSYKPPPSDKRSC
jgi:small GTP-binding protein